MANAIINVGQTGGQVNISTAAAPATPAVGVVTLYAGTDKALHALNSDGTDITIAAAAAASPITVQQTNSLVSTAIGATATASNAVVIGATACATTQNSIAIGTNATACPAGGFGIAIGKNAKVDGNNNGIAIGDGCSQQGQAINIGFSNGLAYNNHIQVGNNNSVPIGGDIFVFGSSNGGGGGSPAGALALGSGNQVGGFGGIKIAVGFNNVNSANCTMALGLANTICSPNAFTNAIGFCNTIHTGATGTVVLGCSSNGGTGACNSVVIGNSAQTTGSCGISIGFNANSGGFNGVVIGTAACDSNFASGLGGVAIGNGACSVNFTRSSTAIGNGACSIGTGSVSLGGCARVTSGYGGLAVGLESLAQGDATVAVGAVTCSQAAFAVAIGTNNSVNQINATALGSYAIINCSNSACSIAVGWCPRVFGGATGTVVIGANSTGATGIANAVVLGPNLTSVKANTTHVNSLIAYGQAASLTNAVGSTGGSVTLDWDNSNIQTLTLTSSITTLTKSNPIDGAVYTLFLTQGGSGGYTVNFGADVDWAGGTGPTLSTAIGATDAVSLVYIAGITGYYGNANLNFA
jgi:hypothetical protein